MFLSILHSMWKQNLLNQHITDLYALQPFNNTDTIPNFSAKIA